MPYTASSLNKNAAFRHMIGRVGGVPISPIAANDIKNINYLKTNENHFSAQLTQQQRMIQDKRKSLDKALLYSYQAAFVQKISPSCSCSEDGLEEPPAIRALINPNKLKQDYDDKILSVGFEADLQPGDLFEWMGTKTKWLIYLQDLTELAYFRGDIRKCSYYIRWKDECGCEQWTYAAVRGPVETKINFIQKHKISIDEPNYSLDIMVPKNEATLAYFKRYGRFYLGGIEANDTPICWRVEAIDSISMPGILQIVAVEYYSNETTDDIENGIADAFIEPIKDPNEEEVNDMIDGPTFIKPKIVYKYVFLDDNLCKDWVYDKKLPLKVKQVAYNIIKIYWDSSYSGQFELKNGDYTKTIIVESLF